MTSDQWIRLWREAYIDLHAAYLALLRVRHQRKGTAKHIIERDMELKDPFNTRAAVGEDGVKKWLEIWEKNRHDNEAAWIMACVTDTMQNHWHSWSAFMDLCPPDLKKFKISVPFDSYLLTATTVSRSTLEKRARVLEEAWERRARGEL